MPAASRGSWVDTSKFCYRMKGLPDSRACQSSDHSISKWQPWRHPCKPDQITLGAKLTKAQVEGDRKVEKNRMKVEVKEERKVKVYMVHHDRISWKELSPSFSDQLLQLSSVYHGNSINSTSAPYVLEHHHLNTRFGCRIPFAEATFHLIRSILHSQKISRKGGALINRVPLWPWC